MMLSNVIVDVTIPRRSFVFGQSRAKVSAGFTNVRNYLQKTDTYRPITRPVFVQPDPRNGDVNNHIAEHHLQTKHQIDWDSATCITYSTDYYQRLTLESWFTNLEQTPLNRSQQLPAPYKRLIDEIKQN